MVHQNYQSLIEMTSNIIYIVAFGVGFKCPRKIHFNTQWGGSEITPKNRTLGGMVGQKLSKIVGHHLWMIPNLKLCFGRVLLTQNRSSKKERFIDCFSFFFFFDGLF